MAPERGHFMPATILLLPEIRAHCTLCIIFDAALQLKQTQSVAA
jgi:hypothetical protein